MMAPPKSGGGRGRERRQEDPTTSARSRVCRRRGGWRGPDGAPAGATGRPGGQAAPSVRPGLKCYDRRDVRLGRAVLEVLVKKRPQDLPAEVQPCITAEFQSAERAAVTDLLAVMPGAHHQKYLVVRGVFRLDRLVDGD